jgi:hypothetical protein
MSNMGKWDTWNSNIIEPSAYGLTETYKMGADFLKDCSVVEDWGCGRGWFKSIFEGNCIAVDGSISPFADKRVDLEMYTSEVPGIFMRHVLEHNYNWKYILINALRSFQEKMVLVLFTPESDVTKEIAFTNSIGVPDISFAFEDLFLLFHKHNVDYDYETLETATQYGVETIFFLRK